MSSNILTDQILSMENLFMSKSLAKIKRLRSKPIFICDICCPRVGNDRRRCLLDESLFLFFFFFLFFYDWGRNWRERFPKIDGYHWLAHTRIDNWSVRELYNSREGDWDFFSNKKTMAWMKVIFALLKQAYFHYCLSSAHHCEDHFHSCLYPQFKYMTFIYS